MVYLFHAHLCFPGWGLSDLLDLYYVQFSGGICMACEIYVIVSRRGLYELASAHMFACRRGWGMECVIYTYMFANRDRIYGI